MNTRVVAFLAAIVLSLVRMLAGEGGPLDQFASSSETTARSPADSAAPEATSSTSGASDFFSLQDAQDDGWTDAHQGPPPITDGPRILRKAPAQPTLGALSKEQLNVEEPVGLAALRKSVEDDS